MKIIHHHPIFIIFFSLICLFENVVLAQTAIDQYLLPKDHYLQSYLKQLFTHGDMFESQSHWQQYGFNVLKRMRKGLMIARHQLIKGFLFKKFQNKVPFQNQLNNYVNRIEGAKALAAFIKENHLQHIVVPNKWLYLLPKKFWKSNGEKAYILIVEDMDIYSGGKDANDEVSQMYYHMDHAILRELCIVVYRFKGLDSMPHNMPFTRKNKIAFVDTEKWNIQRDGFLVKAMPYLSPESQAYAWSIFHSLSN